MKKIIFLCCFMSIAATSFAQIKTNKQIARVAENYKPNTMAVLPLANKDSLELKQLFDNYQQADAVANIALDKLLVKIKSMQAVKPNEPENEMAMIRMQSLVSQRGTILQMITNMINALNEGQKKIVENIGK